MAGKARGLRESESTRYDDALVQLITASGTADDCMKKVQEYNDTGCTCPILYPLGDDVEAMIDAFEI